MTSWTPRRPRRRSSRLTRLAFDVKAARAAARRRSACWLHNGPAGDAKHLVSSTFVAAAATRAAAMAADIPMPVSEPCSR
ncbi:hypothetical protein GSH06_07775 [Burkholderia pseudomallei]|nr:hypothetical protein [Burkholderia pseudomallei]